MDLFREQTAGDGIIADGSSSMTYRELDEASDKIAAYLLDKGVRENEFVAIRMGRRKEFMAAVLGVHKIGAAYVPVDRDYPSARVAYMMQDSEARVILTEQNVFESLQANRTLDREALKCKPGNNAYMIYTSGSTGTPKGVVVTQSALLNLVHFIRERWHLTKESRITCHSNFAFDASVEDLYPVLTAGGSLFIVPEEIRQDIFEMRSFLEKNHITGGCYTTLFGQLLAGQEEPLPVEYICLGGEAMTSTLNTTGKVYNTYGPTEFTVDATYFELEKGREYNPIPIGRPLYNCAAFIVGEKNELLPPGETGELCLSGPQLAKEYWKRPELTEEKFSELQISEGDVRKVYHTGDLARYNEEGLLEFMGRMDSQVKLRGFRIELGEIESRALLFPGIRQAAAQVVHDVLCLYYTSGNHIREDELKAFLSENLADYMIPGCYIRLPRIRITSISPRSLNGRAGRTVPSFSSRWMP